MADNVGDNSRLRAENSAKDHALDIKNQDRNYWRTRCLESEKERDEARDDAEFMLRQWQGVQAIAKETMERVKGDRAKPIDDDDTCVTAPTTAGQEAWHKISRMQSTR